KDRRIEEDRKKTSKENASSWKDSFYNPRTGEVLGRTAGSWGKPLRPHPALLPVFYCFLAGMFALTMWDRVHDDPPNSIEIMYSKSEPKEYKAYVNQLENFLLRYNDTIQEQNMNCPTGEYFVQDDAEEKKVCSFKRGFLSACSGLSDTNFGYSDGQPCILLKLNRIIGLKPRGEPYINCTLKKDYPLNLQYFPHEGRIDKKYFPYYGKKAHENYVQPLVAVKLLLGKDDWNKEHALECRVDGSDLRNNDERDKYLGRINFKVKVME
uniref:Sodium/potassium-transporting ATPase subunit beta n=1 Tax=Neogobius melanostomus TaxID=47308 RepID=A0A8C6UPH6_9GOBI